MRALIDEQYQNYILGSERYLNCLNSEARRARVEYQENVDRYLRYFGADAGLKIDAPG